MHRHNLRMPVRHRRAIRTTNNLERLCVQDRQRHNNIGNAWDGRPMLEMVFGRRGVPPNCERTVKFVEHCIAGAGISDVAEHPSDFLHCSASFSLLSCTTLHKFLSTEFKSVENDCPAAVSRRFAIHNRAVSSLGQEPRAAERGGNPHPNAMRTK